MALALAVGGGWWAARATLEPQTESAEAAAPDVVWAEATSSSVGRSLPLSTTLRQPARTVASNAVGGVVLSTSPGEVTQGDTIYVVAGTPVRVVQGEVPFYRDLARRTKGEDVAQLQQALIDLDYLEAQEPDGDFGWRTEQAVKDWQDDLGLDDTGTIPLGRLVAVDRLPTVVQLGESIVRGATLGGGEEAVLAPTGEQHFVLVVTQDQARMIPAEATVEVTWQDQVWEAVISSSEQDEFGNTEFTLAAPDGGPVCADACGTLPGDAQVTLRSEIVIVPEISGTAVPAAAVHTRADGSAYVITEAGETEVTVRGSGGGVAIVDGIEVGTRVQALAGAAGSPAPAPAPAPGDEATTTEG
ncbi:peptidoglycan-binding domain-containing protein [Ornithinimicrobium murale]|uniref:peptidoglycan-binding domain-containing protein n=1 Tax=Ornithinimicrobium murale TaxID=1050153 RepID=UPI0013B3DC8F|nr:peptidoglycan-binding protein [Ornithinimicrobium murale]